MSDWKRASVPWVLSVAALVVFHDVACQSAAPPAPPSITVVDASVVVTDDQCRVITLRHASGAEESLCLYARDLQRAYDWHAKRDGGQ